MTDDTPYIKMAATARHIQETVLHRAADAGLQLDIEQATSVMVIAVTLASIAHGDPDRSAPWAVIAESAGMIAHRLQEHQP